MNFPNHIVKIENLLKQWHMRNLTNKGKVLVFEYLAISKIVHLSLITTKQRPIFNQPKIMQNNFSWNGKNLKLKHSALSNSREDGG